ncbi:18902_t:CDS:2 [Gigaspora margarita]|uniref:18902_t:CDS:1 n=1 Tax=Gigaspora margarita TaxID=4874 RepID=A0ABN7UNE8_GIGMA|nr:18902_t:CDS:2 [Gigaspora margarita]
MRSQNTAKATKARPMKRSFFRPIKSTVIYLGPIPRSSPPSEPILSPVNQHHSNPSIINSTQHQNGHKLPSTFYFSTHSYTTSYSGIYDHFTEIPFETPCFSPSIIIYKKPRTTAKTPKNLIPLTISTEIPWNIGGLGKILLVIALLVITFCCGKKNCGLIYPHLDF